jgi:hypothetical protein
VADLREALNVFAISFVISLELGEREIVRFESE